MQLPARNRAPEITAAISLFSQQPPRNCLHIVALGEGCPSNRSAAEARKEARKQARKASREKSKAAKPETTERRHRAERFLKDTLAHGPKQVSAIEDAAEKAHVDPHSLEQARGELGVVVSRANTGGAQAVQWSLSAP